MYKFNLFSKPFEVEKSLQEEEDLIITGYASTNDIDRGGDIILPEAWRKGGLDNFSNNPILLFNHNYNSPIGFVSDFSVDEKGLKIVAKISKHAKEIYGLVKDGVLRTFSIGAGIRDADYNKKTDGFVIKDAELYEISVVSVPMNQSAVFSVKKSLNEEDFKKFSHEVIGQDDNRVNTQDNPPSPAVVNSTNKELKMDEDNLDAKLEAAVSKMLDRQAKAAEEKAAKEAAEKALAEKAAEKAAEQAAKIVATSEEKILESVSKKLAEDSSKVNEVLEKFGEVLKEKSAEFEAMRNSKRPFMKEKSADEVLSSEDAKNAFLLSKILKKGFDQTRLGQEIMEKVNAHSGIQVSSDKYEQEISTAIERDIQNELILAPMFREVRLNSASLIFPVLPDAGYAELVGAAVSEASDTETPPTGNLDARGATHGAPYAGIALQEVVLNTFKLSSVSYLGNETEEDAIMPILPLIRESMARSHARAVENVILAGNSPDGVYTANAHNGLLALAATSGRNTQLGATTVKVTAESLLGLRRKMGKYGVRPSDVVYVVSQTAYFDLLEDPEFADANLVGNLAIKLTGEVGQVYGSPVVMCDEFKAPAAGTYTALALNRRNFVVPRLRSVTVESDYETVQQRLALVATQRLGFKEIIPNATAVVGLRYTP